MVKIPESYQKGYINFLKCKIDLSEKVLIPRTETKYWTQKVINKIKKERKKLKVLDIFAGSGCIGIAIFKNAKKFIKKITFIDISEKSIKQIKKNLKLNKISSENYEIYKSSFFKKAKKRKYDLIVANPPYVAEERIKEVGKSVLEHEPKIALFSGKKGLSHIKKFLKSAKKNLEKDGTIYLEFDPQQKGRIKKILKEEGYNHFKFYKDQFKKYRFLKIKK